MRARRFEVQAAERFAERDVILRREVERAGLAPATHFDVRGFVAAFRHGLVEQVRQARDERVDFGLDVGELLVHRREIARELVALRDQRRDVFAAALGHADRLRVRVALGTQLVVLHLGDLALVVERLERVDVEGEAAPREIARDGFGVGAEELYVDHGD